jgi:hypothetical protein
VRISISAIVVVAACAAGGCTNATPGEKATDSAAAASPASRLTEDQAVATSAEANDETASAPANRAAAEKWREVTLPAGTVLPIVLDTAVGSDISREESAVQAHLSHTVSVNGAAAIPENSAVTGVVTDATRAGKVKGRSHLSLRFNTLVLHGSDERYSIQTAAIGRTGPSEKKKDAVKIGAPAAGGAVIGGIVGGKKGAVIGGAVGGGAGTAVVMTDRGEEVRLGKGAALSVKLEQPVTIRVRG